MHQSLLAAVTGADRLTRRQALARVAHLLGGTLSASILASLAARPAAAGAAAVSLGPEQRELLATIVDHIVPGTDTPGARAVGVHDFIEVVWSECFSDDERESFVSGLAEMDQRARRAHGRSFLDCSAGQQLALLERIDGETFGPSEPPSPQRGGEDPRQPATPRAGGMPLSREPGADTSEWVWGEPHRPRPPAPAFWRTLKRLTLVGYYTSEAGATRELQYEPVPGRFDGCASLAQVGRAWAV